MAFGWARSILLGWATLLGLAFLIERPLLHLFSPLFGPMWIATVHLSLDGLTLAAAGFVAGRSNRAHAISSASVFAVTLCFWDFGGAVGLNVPWVLRLVWNSLSGSRFLDSLLTSGETQALLFGCLFAGAGLSRPREKPVSIVQSAPEKRG